MILSQNLDDYDTMIPEVNNGINWTPNISKPSEVEAVGFHWHLHNDGIVILNPGS